MIKKFYVYTGVLSLVVSFIFSFSKTDTDNYFYPIKNTITISSYYGVRQLFNEYSFHTGIDIPASPGTSIYSISNGVVKYIGFDNNGYGNYIIIIHNNLYKSLYAHLSDNALVKLGDNIKKGQIIAYVGPKILSNGKQNGNTTGPHLHFSIYSNSGKTIDPLTLNYQNR
ncbi:MAG: M23 family metallopeptidase [Clostridia bacterium]|nr:M23 family metallopeptidase [Clostridia bacterium]MDD4386372.1 M23 family metallopeptidase [Clostridia bacterium]